MDNMRKIIFILLVLVSTGFVYLISTNLVQAGICDGLGNISHKVNPDPIYTDQGNIDVAIVVNAPNGCLLTDQDYILFLYTETLGTYVNLSKNKPVSSSLYEGKVNFDTNSYRSRNIPFKLCLKKTSFGPDNPSACLLDENYLVYDSSIILKRRGAVLQLQAVKDTYSIGKYPEFIAHGAQIGDELIFWWKGNITLDGSIQVSADGSVNYTARSTFDNPGSHVFCMSTKKEVNIGPGDCRDSNLLQTINFVATEADPDPKPTFTPVPEEIVAEPTSKIEKICEKIEESKKQCEKIDDTDRKQKCIDDKTREFDDCKGCFGFEDGVEGKGAYTALGCIPTDAGGFVGFILGPLMGIAGGIAFLLILGGGFSILFSKGDAEAIQAGRERITAAVLGLLVILFSILILRVIGVDILRLPGFGPE